MLPIPEQDYSNPQVLAGWVELSALAQDDGAAYYGDASEALRDSQLFEDGDSSVANSAAGKLAEVWRVLRRHEKTVAGAWPFELTADALSRRDGRKTSKQVAAYTAMALMEAASLKWYGKIGIRSGDPVREWFEYIAAASIGKFSNGLTVRFGAPFPEGWPKRFSDRVQHLANLFGVKAREPEVIELSTIEQLDDSLDVLTRVKCWDEDAGLPYVLVQCATGANWESHKTGQPSMHLWDKYVAWDGPRLKALAIPFGLRAPGALKNASIRHGDALIFDRLRLAAADPDALITPRLRDDLALWCRGKFDLLGKKAKATLPSQAPTPKRRPNRRGKA